MKLYDLLNKDLLASMVELGYVREQVHPSEPLCILNYTDKATYEKMWNEVTLACRGLIYNMVDEDIVARPFEKFFNYEEIVDHLEVKSDDYVEVTDKADGSLGILYHEPISGDWSIATRGSFASDQAKHATAVFRALDWRPPDRDITYLFEIVYPENRIVLNYGDRDELILLGGMVIDTGVDLGPAEARFLGGWHYTSIKTFSIRFFKDALGLPDRENAEGIVVRFLKSGMRVKMKQADYVALHRIVTGMNDRVVWERLGAGETPDGIKHGLPEEFWPWVDQVADSLHVQAEQTLLSIWEAYLDVLFELPEDFTRKDFALAVKDHPLKKYLFLQLDGKTCYPLVWSTLKPAATRSLVEDDEE